MEPSAAKKLKSEPEGSATDDGSAVPPESTSDVKPESVDLAGLDTAGIRKQIEFYFSDSNLPKDRFLRGEAAKHPEGFVAISTLATFSRVSRFNASIPQIAEVLNSSESLAVSDDKTMVKRVAPLPLEDVTLARSLFVKGGMPSDATIDSLTALFSKYGEVASIRLRKDREKNFNGEVFVEFASDEVAAAALEAMSDFGAEQLKTKQVWLDEYRAERKRKKDADREKNAKKRRKSDGGEEDGEKPAKPVVPAEGLIVAVTNIGEGVNRWDVQAKFEEHGTVKFVEFKEGETSGFVRMADGEEVKAAVKAIAEAETKIGDSVVTCRILEGEEETEYWSKIPVGKPKHKKGKKRRRN